MRDAKGLSLSDGGVLHLGTLFSLLLSNLRNLGGLSLLLLLLLHSLALLLLLLLLDLFLLLRQSGARLSLNSESNGSRLGGLSNASLGRDTLITLVLVAVTTETLELSVAQSGVFNLNSLAIKDNSAEGSLNNKDVITGSKIEVFE